MESNYPSLADISAITRNNGFGNGEGMWLFALLILFGGFNGWNNRGYNNDGLVTEAGLCNANSFSELKGSVGRISDQIDSMNVGLSNGICQLGSTMLTSFGNTDKQIQQTSCENLRAIDSLKLELANSTASINANNTINTQKILDKMNETENQNLRQRIAQLELKNELCGIVRYPIASTYSVGNPFSCNTGCNNAII